MLHCDWSTVVSVSETESQWPLHVVSASETESQWPLHVVSASETESQWPLHVASTCGLYMWPLQVASTCGLCMWPLRVASTCGLYMWPLRVASTCGLYMWPLHVASACGLGKRSGVSVVCSSGPGASFLVQTASRRHGEVTTVTKRRGGVRERWRCTAELRPRSDALGQGAVAC